MITQWHFNVATLYARRFRGTVRELRKKKATISTPAGKEYLAYWQMEEYLIQHGVIQPNSSFRHSKSEAVSKISKCLSRAKQVAGNLFS